jgi:hypothetical protein
MKIMKIMAAGGAQCINNNKKWHRRHGDGMASICICNINNNNV